MGAMTATTSTDDAAPDQAAERPSGRATMTLRRAAGSFLRYPSPRLLLPATAAAWAARLLLGRWRWWDLVVPAIILGLEPFTEWTVHVYLLHFRPRQFRRWTIDPLASRKHRQHHRDPRRPELIFVPFPVLVTSLVVGAILYWVLIPNHRLALTAIAASYSMLSAYEWTHFLIHSTYLPKSRAYRYVWRAHRLHHYRNEHYWFGVTVHAADHLLGTFPDKDEVPLSPTARTLGVEEAA
jgi:Fatty acid hydroxylase superfamily